MKIAELIEQYSNLTKKEAQEVKQPSPLTSLFLPSHTKPFHSTRDIKKAPTAPQVPVIKKSSEEKVAFVPNPQVAQQMQQQSQQPQQMPGAAQQQAPAPQAQAMPQSAPAQMTPPAPSQEQALQQPPQQQTLMDEVMNAAQQLPPEIQQQVQPLLQQLQSLPPEQREQQLGMILQQMMPQGTPAGMEAQAGMEEDLLMAAQQQQPQQPSSMMPQEQAQSEDAASAEASAVEAKNELDNVRVNLSVRELLDLIGKGSATASLLKVKQLADQHNQKMEAIKQKAENEKQQKVEEEQSAQSPENMMGAGGIYSQPMTAVN